ncbi:MAG: phosphoribosylformylglycinamidine synthase subunit PurQ [Proteobacteria bacterium]|jgi:phosphoribosylformylglycinamidine synthase|nr:phosphoribosylformylglycinamidine synthase subunit PurQ [Alphaproteobacteria bacterium]NCC03211.1 phosphoribosylformylglycinamidine synthase subunit PurQ [Pseudomonadota bacterium]
MKAAVIVFPGSNCDRDAKRVLEAVTGKPAHMVWHADTDLPDVDLILLPGGFSYGDYLRTGAMAAHSPVMREVVAKAGKGVKVLGICNGFQILCESGLLPGVLLRNVSLKFVCRHVPLRVETNQTIFTSAFEKGQSVSIPVAHGEGNYFADAQTIEKLEGNGQVVFRYLDNPNGSMNDIAGIMNDKGNVLGMMPHPERVAEPLHGCTDGRIVFESLVKALAT